MTGYLIARPLPSIGGEATFSYYFANVRMIHFIAAMLFAVLFLVRLVWAIVGNRHARSIFLPPVWSGEWWSGLFHQTAYYLFLRKAPHHWVGHNPLAQLAMFVMFVLGTFVIVFTGLSLFAEQFGWGSGWMNGVRVGERAARRLADGAHRAPARHVVARAVRAHPRLHGVPRGHHERRDGDQHDDQRRAHVQARAALVASSGYRCGTGLPRLAASRNSTPGAPL